MSLSDAIAVRGITEVVHFSTSFGLLGILSTGKILPRAALPGESALEFILKYNSKYRSDPQWLSHVNLSISRINHHFFDHSGSWHNESELFWVVLGISPEILSHDEVYFTTTNNIYPSCVRHKGVDGLEKMFSQVVKGRYGVEINRGKSHLSNWTTCPQAEVLYPGTIPINFVRNIYVKNASDQDAVYAQIAALGSQDIQVTIAPNKFADGVKE